MKQNFSTMNEVTKVDEFCFHCYNNNNNTNNDNNKKLQQQPGRNNLLSNNPVYPQSLTRPINNTHFQKLFHESFEPNLL